MKTMKRGKEDTKNKNKIKSRKRGSDERGKAHEEERNGGRQAGATKE